MLKIERPYKTYGSKEAVHHLSTHIHPGKSMDLSGTMVRARQRQLNAAAES